VKPYGYLGSYRRVERAGHRLAEVEHLAATFRGQLRDIGGSLGSISEGNELFDLRDVDVPDELSIAAGETIYNLRASLDYLVFALSWHDSGDRPVDKLAQDLQFPISADSVRFMQAAKRRLQGVSADHVMLLESYQPYRGRPWMARLADLSNADKHRHMLDLVGRIGINHERRSESIPDDGALPDEHGLYGMEELIFVDEAKMDAAFADGALVAPTLAELCQEVRELVERFAQEFNLLPIEPKPDWPV
jgi:hypothetical protein